MFDVKNEIIGSGVIFIEQIPLCISVWFKILMNLN